jgi:hypothetical protein
MAENKKKIAEGTEPEDPWTRMREIIVPKKRNGDQESIYVAVNGRSFSVPCTGRPQMVPEPIYEALVNAQLLRDQAEENAKAATKRLLDSAARVNL